MALAVLLALHFILSVLYSALVPPWEAHDEWAHYKYVEYVAQNWRLPPPGVRLTSEYQYDEATQPPLYYVLAAPLVALVDPHDGLRPQVNPYATRGTGEGGVNMAIHDPQVEGWPWRGTILALHLARLVSVIISTLALLPTYGVARLLVGSQAEADPLAQSSARSPLAGHAGLREGPDTSTLKQAAPLLAVAIHGFSLQWLFIGGVVTNDVLVAALGGAILFCALHLVLRPPSLSVVIGLAAFQGLALLAKYTALALLPVTLMALAVALVKMLRRSQPGSDRSGPASLRRVATVAIAFAATLAVVAGWYFWRNLRLYGRLASRDAHAELSFWQRLVEFDSSAPTRLVEGLAWSQVPDMLVYGFRTFWASFGWGNVEAASWVYWMWAALCLVGLAGFVVWLWRSHQGLRWVAAGLMLLQIALSTALPLYRDLLHGQDLLRGRYILPALTAIAAIIAIGLLGLLPRQATGYGRRWQRSFSLALVGLLLIIALVAPFAWILPAYAQPSQVGTVEVAERLRASPILEDPAVQPGQSLPYPLRARFTSPGGDLVEVVSYDLWPSGESSAEAEVSSGQGLAVTIEWRVLRRAARDYTVGVHLLGRNGQSLSSVNHYPGNGNLASSVWRPGDRWIETFWLPVGEASPQQDDVLRTPSLGRISLALFERDTGAYLPVVAEEGSPLGNALIFGRVRIAPTHRSGLAGADEAADVIEPEMPGLDSAAALFGEPASVALLNYDVDGELRPGGQLRVTLDWLALAPGEADLVAFVQLVSPNDGLQWIAGADHPPDAEYPTGLWLPGDRVSSEAFIDIPSEWQETEAWLLVGLYDPLSEVRLPVGGQPPSEQPHSSDAVLIDLGPTTNGR